MWKGRLECVFLSKLGVNRDLLPSWLVVKHISLERQASWNSEYYLSSVSDKAGAQLSYIKTLDWFLQRTFQQHTACGLYTCTLKMGFWYILQWLHWHLTQTTFSSFHFQRLMQLTRNDVLQRQSEYFNMSKVSMSWSENNFFLVSIFLPCLWSKGNGGDNNPIPVCTEQKAGKTPFRQTDTFPDKCNLDPSVCLICVTQRGGTAAPRGNRRFHP